MKQLKQKVHDFKHRRRSPIIVGYWAQTKKSVKKEQLPWPIPCTRPQWKRKKKVFLKRLTTLESKASSEMYQGWSNCRLCHKRNGSGEFAYRNYRWPSGYKHYIDKHSIRPPKDFRRFVRKHVKG